MASGLSISHDVGIFDLSSQTLLTAATVPAGTSGFLDSGFIYVSLASPYSLAAGDYVIAMTMLKSNPDLQYIEVTSETTSSPVTYVDSRFGEGSVLAFPIYEGFFAPGLFGPNFQFASVPEPSSLVMASCRLACIWVTSLSTTKMTSQKEMRGKSQLIPISGFQSDRQNRSRVPRPVSACFFSASRF